MARDSRSRGKKAKKGPPKEIGPDPKASQEIQLARPSLARRLWARLAGLRWLLRDIKNEPLLVVPVLAGLICAGWVLYNAHRPWVKVDALISSRDVAMETESDEDGQTDHYIAYLGYIYSLDQREFHASFPDTQVGHNQRRSLGFEEAVVEAKRHELGNRLSVYVDSRHPAISALKPPRTFWPLFGVVLSTLFVFACVATGPLVLAFVVGWQLFLTWNLTRITPSEELDAAYQVRPYLEQVRAYPSLGYVPQNNIRQFDSFEELLKNWGRPDELWVDDMDQSRLLVLTYRHAPDWSQAWKVDFQIPQDGSPPIPIGPPRKDDPKR